jgi:hypothetical protein
MLSGAGNKHNGYRMTDVAWPGVMGPSCNACLPESRGWLLALSADATGGRSPNRKPTDSKEPALYLFPQTHHYSPRRLYAAFPRMRTCGRLALLCLYAHEWRYLVASDDASQMQHTF